MQKNAQGYKIYLAPEKINKKGLSVTSERILVSPRVAGIRGGWALYLQIKKIEKAEGVGGKIIRTRQGRSADLVEVEFTGKTYNVSRSVRDFREWLEKILEKISK